MTPCLVIAGTHSGVGKTSISTALMAAFTRSGRKVQGFKIGPDFIDPGFHRVATGRPSHNLDGWILSREANLALYQRATEDADLAIVEGAMGLFDGRSGTEEAGSTAEMAKWLGAPVLLVVDGAAMARSGAAVVHGFESFDPDLTVSGVLFNRVSGEKHFAYLRDSVRSRCQAVPLGFLPPEPKIQLPERHLGLRLAEETATTEWMDALVRWIERSVDLEQVWATAEMKIQASRRVGTAGSQGSLTAVASTLSACRVHTRVDTCARIAIAKDPAFQFYYDENLRYLSGPGAELVPFSPISDSNLPQDIDAIYLGGGYPELHAAALDANVSMRQSIRQFAENNGPIYAECGGFMYLTEEIVDAQGHSHEMCGIFPTRARMQPRLAALGYVEIEQVTDVAWLHEGERLRGHQFRYSVIDDMPESIRRVYRVHNRQGTALEGYVRHSVLGSYCHLHFGSSPAFAQRFVAAAKSWRSSKELTGISFS